MNLDPTWVQLLTSLLTILASGVVTTIVGYRLNSRRDQVQFMRLKAEALYMAAQTYLQGFDVRTLARLKVAEGLVTFNAALDMEIEDLRERGEAGASAHETMTMLLRVYFPELKPLLDEVHRQRDHLNEILAAHKAAYQAGEGESRTWRDRIAAAAMDLDRAGRALKDGILDAARRYAGARAA